MVHGADVAIGRVKDARGVVLETGRRPYGHGDRSLQNGVQQLRLGAYPPNPKTGYGDGGVYRTPIARALLACQVGIPRRRAHPRWFLALGVDQRPCGPPAATAAIPLRCGTVEELLFGQVRAPVWTPGPKRKHILGRKRPTASACALILHGSQGIGLRAPVPLVGALRAWTERERGGFRAHWFHPDFARTEKGRPRQVRVRIGAHFPRLVGVLIVRSDRAGDWIGKIGKKHGCYDETQKAKESNGSNGKHRGLFILHVRECARTVFSVPDAWRGTDCGTGGCAHVFAGTGTGGGGDWTGAGTGADGAVRR